MVFPTQLEIPEWAYGHGAKKSEPPESVKEKGWGADDAPSAEVFNWWMGGVSKCLDDLKKIDQDQYGQFGYNGYQPKKIRARIEKLEITQQLIEFQSKHYHRKLQKEVDYRFKRIIDAMAKVSPEFAQQSWKLHKYKGDK